MFAAFLFPMLWFETVLNLWGHCVPGCSLKMHNHYYFFNNQVSFRDTHTLKGKMSGNKVKFIKYVFKVAVPGVSGRQISSVSEIFQAGLQHIPSDPNTEHTLDSSFSLQIIISYIFSLSKQRTYQPDNLIESAEKTLYL